MLLRMMRSRMGIKISLRLVALSVPLMAVAAWVAISEARSVAAGMLVDQGRVAALAGARAYGAILESGVDSGALTLADLTDPSYEEISFAVHVEDKRYHTRFDGYTDSHGIQGIEDAILASSPAFIYASGIDVRGYVPTPHKKYAEAPTGDPKHDRAVSRAKRKYDQPEHLAAAGYLGNEPTLVQDYHRDTGEQIWDIAAPIFVHGKHFGAFRVGVVKERVHVETLALARDLAWTLGAAVLLIGVAAMVAAQRSTRQLRELACAATRLSTTHDGSELRQPIRATTTDEVGQMARALDRIRQSFLVIWDKI